MVKQTIEIEVPEGKKAVWNEKHKRIEFVHIDSMEDIKTFNDAWNYLANKDMCVDLLAEHGYAKRHSYSEKLCEYRIIVAALTNNEKFKLRAEDYYFPVVQFCEIGKEKNCWGSHKIGTIEHDGRKYTVMGGHAERSSNTGIGCYNLRLSVSTSWTGTVFLSVPSREIAEYISKQFGRLLFEIQYGGTNCNWEWVD